MPCVNTLSPWYASSDSELPSAPGPWHNTVGHVTHVIQRGKRVSVTYVLPLSLTALTFSVTVMGDVLAAIREKSHAHQVESKAKRFRDRGGCSLSFILRIFRDTYDLMDQAMAAS